MRQNAQAVYQSLESVQAALENIVASKIYDTQKSSPNKHQTEDIGAEIATAKELRRLFGCHMVEIEADERWRKAGLLKDVYGSRGQVFKSRLGRYSC
jgi:hypothetical protein